MNHDLSKSAPPPASRSSRRRTRFRGTDGKPPGDLEEYPEVDHLEQDHLGENLENHLEKAHLEEDLEDHLGMDLEEDLEKDLEDKEKDMVEEKEDLEDHLTEDLVEDKEEAEAA